MRNSDPVFPEQGASLSLDRLLTLAAQTPSVVLGALLFAPDARAQPPPVAFPCLRVALPRFDAGEPVAELWRASAGAALRGRHGAIEYCDDGETVFGVLSLDETVFAGEGERTPLQQATESAYREVFALLDALACPHLYRFWNYLAAINAASFGSERYRQFNRGRYDAFQAHSRNSADNAPAACALGTSAGPLCVAFLAGRRPPLRIENPRQTSAYRYPQQYGPRSPTFSRATLAHIGADEVLLLSGTASVVGHATLHAGDVGAQTRETLSNIDAVLAAANRVASGAGFALPDLDYRVYVRHADDEPAVRREFERALGAAARAVYLKADVCRDDLLVEIEASAAVALGAKAR